MVDKVWYTVGLSLILCRCRSKLYLPSVNVRVSLLELQILLVQIASGRLRREIFVLLRLIGVAVGFAGLLRGLRKSIDGAEKARTYYGVPISELLLSYSEITMMSLLAVVCNRSLLILYEYRDLTS